MTYEDALKAFGGQNGAVGALSEEGQESYAAAMAGAQMTYDAIRAANVGGYWKAKKGGGESGLRGQENRLGIVRGNGTPAMTAKSVTAEYVAGILDARQHMRASLPDWPDHESLCRDMLASVQYALKRPGYPRPIRDTWRGERDFWLGQLKRYR